jgi:hypothetical protein
LTGFTLIFSFLASFVKQLQKNYRHTPVTRQLTLDKYPHGNNSGGTDGNGDFYLARGIISPVVG